MATAALDISGFHTISSEALSPPESPLPRLHWASCPLCNLSWNSLDEARRMSHLNTCLDDFHRLETVKPKLISKNRREDEEKRMVRFSKADTERRFSFPSTQVVTTPRSSANSTRIRQSHLPRVKRGRLSPSPTVDLPWDVWRLVSRFCEDLFELRSCSKGLQAISEREALERISRRLWFEVCFKDSESLVVVNHSPSHSLSKSMRYRSSYVTTEFHSRKKYLEVVPCVNVSLDGRIRAYLIFVQNAGEGGSRVWYRSFANEWERVTGIPADRATFTTCADNIVSGSLGPSTFPKPRMLRTTGVFAFERPSPLSPKHITVHVRWRGPVGEGSAVRYFGIPFRIVLPTGSTRKQVHRAVYDRASRFFKPCCMTHSSSLPYVLNQHSLEFSQVQRFQQFPEDSAVQIESECMLVMDFVQPPSSIILFDFFGPLSEQANEMCLTATIPSIVAGLVKRDCGVRIFQTGLAV